MTDLVPRILEDYRRLMAQQYCLTNEDILDFRTQAKRWFDTIILEAPSLKSIQYVECWPEVEDRLDKIMRVIDAQKGTCYPSKADAVYQIRRYYGLAIQGLKFWAQTNCEDVGEAGTTIGPAAPAPGQCRAGEKLRVCVLSDCYFEWGEMTCWATCDDGAEGRIYQGNFDTLFMDGITVQACSAPEPFDWYEP